MRARRVGETTEITPQYGATSDTLHVGGQMLFEILSVMTRTTRDGGEAGHGELR